MSIESRVLSLAILNSVTNDLIPITGLGFQPKFIMFTGGMSADTNPTNNAVGLVYGFYGSSGQYCINTAIARLAGPVIQSKSRLLTSICYINMKQSPGLIPDLTFHIEAVNDDGFDIRVDNGSVGLTDIQAFCMGGDDIDADVIQWAMPTAAGSHSVSGVSFTPQALMHFYLGTPTLNAQVDHTVLGVGMCADSMQLSHCFYDEDGAPAINHRLQRDDASILVIDSGGNISAEATHTAFDSGGFEVDFITAPPTGFQVITVCLGSASTNWIGGLLDRPDVSELMDIPTNGIAPKAFFGTSYCYTPSVSPPGDAAHTFFAFNNLKSGGDPFTVNENSQRQGMYESVALQDAGGSGSFQVASFNSPTVIHNDGDLTNPAPINWRTTGLTLYTGECDDPTWILNWSVSGGAFPTQYGYLWIGDTLQDDFFQVVAVTAVVLEILTIDSVTPAPTCESLPIHETPIVCEATLFDKNGTLTSHTRMGQYALCGEQLLSKSGTLVRPC